MEASDSRGKWSFSPLGPSCGHMRRRPRLLLRPAAGVSSPVPGPPKYRVAGVVWSAGDGPRKRARRGALASSTAERFGPAALPPSSFERLPSRVRASPLGATGKKKPSSYAALLTEPALAAFACSEGSHLAEGGRHCPRFVCPEPGSAKRRRSGRGTS